MTYNGTWDEPYNGPSGNCEHGEDIDKYCCPQCENHDWAVTCPTCDYPACDKLSLDGYACPDCDTVYTVVGDDKNWYEGEVRMKNGQEVEL